jgi:Type II intron maturase/Reverse transcriptase (RNA-dependent DNA polymerase)
MATRMKFFLRHFGTCKKSVSMRISGLEFVTTFQGKSKVLQSMGLFGGFAKLRNLKNNKVKHFRLIDIIGDSGVLKVAYEIIKLRFSSLDYLVKGEVPHFISYDFIKKIGSEILKGYFKFKNVRRIEIFKPSKQSLKIGNVRDKIVQHVISMVLEQIFSVRFFRTSHGFRVGKGCHSALNQIQCEWLGISWFLEFDVYKHFDVINCRRLISILGENIGDLSFLDLITDLFDTGVVGWHMKTYLWSTSIFKGCLISSILCNIYLHKLDLEVFWIQKKFNSCNGNFFYKKSKRVMMRPLNKFFTKISDDKKVDIIKQKQRGVCDMYLISKDWKDTQFIKVAYVRYVDDILFGVVGPKSLVVLVKKRVIQFVKSDLRLELIGGEVTHASFSKVLFLGVAVSGVSRSKSSWRFCKALEKRKRVVREFAILRRVKQDKVLRALQLGLKKAVKSVACSKVKNSYDFKLKFHAIKENILLDGTFIRSSIAGYKEFIKRIYLSYMFVPDTMKNILRVFESELTHWENSLKKSDSRSFVNKYKKLTESFVTLPLLLHAPLKGLRERLKFKGILTKFNKPVAVNQIINQPDYVIVGWFRSVAQGFLDYYRCCNNFSRVKNYVNYFVRWSAIHTLAKKYRSSCRDIIFKWSKNLTILNSKGYKLIDFLHNKFIKSMGRKFLMDINLNAGLLVLNSIWLRCSCFKWFGLRCAFKKCSETNIIKMYTKSELSRTNKFFGFVSIMAKKKKLVIELEDFKIISNSNNIPLCKNHYQYLCHNKINFFDLDWNYLKIFE